jgi:hypothetical protein
MVVSRFRYRVPIDGDVSEHWSVRQGVGFRRVVAFFRYLIIESPYAGYGVSISANVEL